ncbi:MAG TPA: chaperone modulator CbpM [Stellaceae bacterium]|jgi:chaperone modulatory protein CbpM|nr:chaperone modulator CbpM [Stellaceae bacterium]
MIAFEAVLREVRGLEAAELERWIAVRWVRPERRGEVFVFHEIDVARIHLIVELRRELMIDDEAMPVVLHLLDQIYALRHRLTSLAHAIDSLPPDIKETLRAHFEA